MVDWIKIKTEYITTNTSYRRLAEKYGVSHVQIGNVGKQERWVELRRQHLDKTLAKTLAADSRKKADRLTRINNATDRLLDRIEQAITELDMMVGKSTDKTKTIEYENPGRPDKPTKEIVHEEERVLEYKTIVDRQGLKQIASALRDIKEAQMLRTVLDEQEQEARIAKIRREAEADKEDKNRQISIQIEGGEGSWAE